MFKRAISYYKPYKKLFVIDLIRAVLVAILEMVFDLGIALFDLRV